MITLEKVTKFYKDADNLIMAANEISLNINKGDFISIIGPSGSGKTTLLSLIGCLVKPSGGTISIDGKATSQLSDDELSELRSSKIGFVFQGSYVIPNLTMIENVMLPLVFLKEKDLKAKREKAVELIKQVGLFDRVNSLPRDMSGGQVKRVSIARALINNPSILLADEPTGDLDNESSKEIMDLLLNINKQLGVTVLLVTHSQELACRASIKLKMHSGKIV